MAFKEKVHRQEHFIFDIDLKKKTLSDKAKLMINGISVCHLLCFFLPFAQCNDVKMHPRLGQMIFERGYCTNFDKGSSL